MADSGKNRRLTGDDLVSVHLALGRQLNWLTGPPPRSEIRTGQVTPGMPDSASSARMAKGPGSTMWWARSAMEGFLLSCAASCV